METVSPAVRRTPCASALREQHVIKQVVKGSIEVIIIFFMAVLSYGFDA